MDWQRTKQIRGEKSQVFLREMMWGKVLTCHLPSVQKGPVMTNSSSLLLILSKVREVIVC